MSQGIIKKLLSDKGFGFISAERGELFFHHSAWEGAAIESLNVGQRGTYEEGRGPKGPTGGASSCRLARVTMIGKVVVRLYQRFRSSNGGRSVAAVNVLATTKEMTRGF